MADHDNQVVDSAGSRQGGLRRALQDADRWRRSGLIRSATRLMSGRLAAMAIGIIGAPILARLFVPGDYGIAASLVSMMMLTSSVLSAGYSRAILFPREDQTAAELLMLVLAISTLLSLVLYVILMIVDVAGLRLPGPLSGSTLLWLLPLGALLLVVREALNTLTIRRRQFGILAGADVLQSGAMLLSRVVWGLALGSAALGLVIGQFIGVIAAVAITWAACRQWFKSTMASGDLSSLIRVAKKFSDYPKFRVSARIAFQTAEQMPVLALGLMFPVEVVGFFAMAHRVADLPLQAAARALSDAILGSAIKKRHANRPLGSVVWKSAAGLAVIGVPTFTFMYVCGGEMLTWFLGARWETAGRIVEILSLYLFCSWMASPFLPMFETLRQNKQFMLLNSLNLLARTGAFSVSYMAALDIYATLWVFSVVCASHAVVTIAAAAYVVRRHDSELTLEQT